MTNEEAIKRLDNMTIWRNFWCGCYKEELEAIEIAKEALEKQIPKKPEEYTDRTSWANYYACPNCGTVIVKGCGCHNNDCRQAIDWSEM